MSAGDPTGDGTDPTLYRLATDIADAGQMVLEHWREGIERRAGTMLGEPLRGVVGALSVAGRPAGRLPRLGLTRTRESPAVVAGPDLLRQSADIDHPDDDQHPAFRRILTEVTPDEARIIRLLHLEGPQPVVDVKAGLPPASRLEGHDLTMIGADAGCRRIERVPSYLNNLARLGLVAVGDASVADPLRYQLLEVQPDVVNAIESAGRTARTARKRLELTPFGTDFAVECMELRRTGDVGPG